MAVQENPTVRPATGDMQTDTRRASETAPEHGAVMTPTSAKVFAVARIAAGFLFLWAFLDKAFGWGYATQAGNGWIDGGSPTYGFLSNVSAGPFQSMFHSMAGDGWVNLLFMLGLLGVGIGLLSGVALRLTAAAGTLMMAMMWAAEWPPAQHMADGSLTMSTNPLVNYHVLYALLIIALAVAYAGNTWGLGRTWARLEFVRRNRWLL
ncbi:hypothetical protein PJ985_06910 [Streptomyces sp. ACA25]|uniref:hypothetical protein n=1 Tax=Streptomyces sp. ACA25 TaxID=3022596 RepID=UPI002308354E|nr:hypothetical protein [Streptomyces sp. ACA25]MDB1087297.1 hypothetical protein [Streptomyces sp. ACA25]